MVLPQFACCATVRNTAGKLTRFAEHFLIPNSGTVQFSSAGC